jgi:hypothetical protein
MKKRRKKIYSLNLPWQRHSMNMNKREKNYKKEEWS